MNRTWRPIRTPYFRMAAIELNRCDDGCGAGWRRACCLRSARVWVLPPTPRRETPDDRDKPSPPPHDRGHDGPQSVAGDSAILRPCGCEVRRFFGRSPEKLDLEDVRAFQVHLVARGMSWPALNQTVCALRFFYGVTLGRPTCRSGSPMPASHASCRWCWAPRRWCGSWRRCRA